MSTQEQTARELEGLTLGQLGERIQGACHMLGVWTGYSQAARLMREKSGECFAAGRDAEAQFYRDAAKRLEEAAKTTREAYDREYRPRERAAFEELDAREKDRASGAPEQ